jgi:hypothetical protein
MARLGVAVGPVEFIDLWLGKAYAKDPHPLGSS